MEQNQQQTTVEQQAQTDREFMSIALEHARTASSLGEVPVGAVVVRNGQVIGWGFNLRERGKNALHHGELAAIHMACSRLGGWRLFDCDLYVTLEPCPMCAGAIINSRIRRVIYGTGDPKAGSCGSLVNLFEIPYNHIPQITSGVLEDECAGLLQTFFRDLRKEKDSKSKIVQKTEDQQQLLF